MLDIIVKDLGQVARDWRGSVFLLVMPIAFTLLFGFAFGGFGGVDQDTRLVVALADLDQSMVSEQLTAALENSEVIRVERSDVRTVDGLGGLVDKQKAAAALRIPEGFGDRALAGDTLPFALILDPANMNYYMIEAEISSLSGRFQAALRGVDWMLSVRDTYLPASVDDLAVAREALLARALALWNLPGGTVFRTDSTRDSDSGAYNSFAHTSPGMMMQFAIAGLIGAAEILVVERKNHSLHRLMTTTLTRAQILLGHFFAMVVMIALQIGVLALFGALFLRLNYFDHLGASLLMLVSSSLFAGSLGLLIGSLAKNEEQVVLYAMIPMFILSGLGGAWMPLESTSKTFQRIAHFTPVSWAIDGFKNILVRGQGIEGVWQPAAVLFGFAVLCLVLGIIYFNKRSEV
ncbi:MAG: ABC transporter permease [Anaerolineaceae bacterium]|nr:ABC transporter permease [Anaerolineaceae bacterium]